MGARAVRPNSPDNHDSVKMVWHHDEHVQDDFTTEVRRSKPFVRDHPTEPARAHSAVCDAAKQR